MPVRLWASACTPASLPHCWRADCAPLVFRVRRGSEPVAAHAHILLAALPLSTIYFPLSYWFLWLSPPKTTWAQILVSKPAFKETHPRELAVGHTVRKPTRGRVPLTGVWASCPSGQLAMKAALSGGSTEAGASRWL